MAKGTHNSTEHRRKGVEKKGPMLQDTVLCVTVDKRLTCLTLDQSLVTRNGMPVIKLDHSAPSLEPEQRPALLGLL